MDKKKMLLALISISLVMGSVLAVWYFGTITGYSVYQVNSNKPNQTIIKQLSGGIIDTSDEAKNFTDTLDIYSNKNMKAIININTIKSLIDPDCTNWSEDCKVSYYFNENYGFQIPLVSGQEIDLVKDLNTIHAKVECARFSCPQNLSVEINIIPKNQ